MISEDDISDENFMNKGCAKNWNEIFYRLNNFLQRFIVEEEKDNAPKLVKDKQIHRGALL